LKSVFLFSINLLIKLIYLAYKAEGLNALFLLLPAKLIAPTLRQHGAIIGQNVEIHSPLIVHNASPDKGRHYANLVIGDDCYFGREVFFDLKDQVRIEDRVTVSMRVTFITHTDVGKSPLAEQIPPSHAPVILRQGAYIGAAATLLQGVEIGACGVVAAGALVNRRVPEHTTVAGVPAKPIRQV
jgi:acetyltransferase-like isoleucine patch superfamily enzyme